MEALGAGVLHTGHEGVDASEVTESTGMVGVQMGQDKPAHVAPRIDTERAELRADLLLRADPLLHSETEIGLPAGKIAGLAGAGRLAGIHDDNALWMLNDPGVDGQRLGPPTIKQGVEPTDVSVSFPAPPALRDGDSSGLDGMDAHVGLSFLTGLRAK